MSKTRLGSRATWVVISGALRSPLEFRATLAKALDFRKAGLVQEVCLSTWFEEIDRVPGLRRLLQDFGVHVAEVRDVPVAGPQNIWRQFRTYDVGLRLCPDEALVLRSRTDKGYVYFDMWRNFIESDAFLPEEEQEPSLTLFPGRIFVPYLSLSAPFFCKDICFFGSRRALQELTHYENWSVAMGYETTWAELRWFSYPFIRRFSLIRDVLETVPYNKLSTAICRKGTIPSVVSRFLGVYYRLLAENLMPMSKDMSVASFPIEGLLDGSGGLCSVASVPDGDFTATNCTWMFRHLTTLGKPMSRVGEEILAAFRDPGLPYSWSRLSDEERLDLVGFVSSERQSTIPRFIFAPRERREANEGEVISALNDLDPIPTKVLEVEYEITKSVLRRDAFSPILECELASYWYKQGEFQRGRYWFERAFSSRVVVEYKECLEALIRFARAEWVREAQPEAVVAEKLNWSEVGPWLVEQMIAPQLRSRVENLVALAESCNQKDIPEPIFKYLVHHLAVIAEQTQRGEEKRAL